MSAAPATMLAIPVEGVLRHPQSGREHVLLDGQPQRVIYDVDAATWRMLHWQGEQWTVGDPVWRSEATTWVTGTLEAWRARPSLPSQLLQIELSAMPQLPTGARALPRLLHYIWIGDEGLTTALVSNLRHNAGRCGVYRSVVHVHAESDDGLARIRMQVAGAALDVRDLRQAPEFQVFQRTALGQAYRQLLQPATRNAGAASDILRVVLLHHHGGIYIDCDDTLVQPFPADEELSAGPQDVLLNRWVGAHGLGYFGYNQSCFASQPGNPVLAALLQEMEQRLSNAGDFLTTPRPWRDAGNAPGERSPALEAYIRQTLDLTGPVVFNAVLQQCRPDYHLLELWLMHAYTQTTWSPSEPRYLVQDYLQRMHAALAHYLPFASGRFEVAIGNADSWNAAPVDR